MDPCWAMMLTTADLADIEFDGAYVSEEPLFWTAHDGAKPARWEPNGLTSWTIHASAKWSADHLVCCPSLIQDEMLDVLQRTLRIPLQPVHCKVHRLRYAVPAVSMENQWLRDPVAGLGACGDWCLSSSIEGAFLSGMSMAGALLRHMTVDRPAPTAFSNARSETTAG